MLGMERVKKILKEYIDKKIEGNNEEMRERMKKFVWGEEVNERGERKKESIRKEKRYRVKIKGELEIIDYILKKEKGGGEFKKEKLIGKGMVESMKE